MKTRADMFKTEIETLKNKLALLKKAKLAICGKLFEVEPDWNAKYYYQCRFDEIDEMMKQCLFETMEKRLYNIDYSLIDNDKKDYVEITEEVEQIFRDADIQYRN